MSQHYAVFDRPRTIVKKGGVGRDVEALNSTFAQAVVDRAVGVEMCAARSGDQCIASSPERRRRASEDRRLRSARVPLHRPSAPGGSRGWRPVDPIQVGAEDLPERDSFTHRFSR